MKSRGIYVAAGTLAALICAGNAWVVHSGGCPDPGACQCVVTLSQSGTAGSGNPNPSCSVKTHYTPFSTSTLKNCDIVEPGNLDRIVMCDVGVQANLRCQSGSATVGSGTAKIFGCVEHGNYQPNVTGTHYDGWTNNVGPNNTNASANFRSLRGIRKMLLGDDGQPVFTMVTETEVLAISNADAGFNVESNNAIPRVTLTQGQAMVRSFCDGNVAQLNGPAVIDIKNDSALQNLLSGLTTTFDPTAGTCALTDLSGNWRGAYFNLTQSGDYETVAFVMSVQGTTGTITTPTDTLDITSFNLNAPSLRVNAKSRASGGTFSLSATVTKGEMVVDARADGIGPDGKDFSFGNGSAERVIISEYAIPKAGLNAPYQVQLYAGGPADGPLIWSIASGNLPDGMVLDGSNGTISGTASANGDYNFTVQAVDPNGDMFQQPLTLTVNTMALAANILPIAYYGQVNKYTVQVVGGTPPYTFSNDLPFPFAGFPQLSATGNVTVDYSTGPGSPSNLTFHVKDANNVSQKFVIEMGARSVTLSGSQILPVAIAGTPYTYTFPTNGVVGTTKWQPMKDLELIGLQFDTSTGTLSGTPTLSGKFGFKINVADSYGDDARKFNLEIDDSATPAPATVKPCRGCKPVR